MSEAAEDNTEDLLPDPPEPEKQPGPPEAPTDEDIASKRGWKPRDDFYQDPDNEGKPWFPADRFLERGEFFDEISRLKRENRETKESVKELLKEEREATRKQTLERLRKEHSEAVEAGDADKAWDAAQRISEAEKPAEPEVPAAARAFIERNLSHLKSNRAFVAMARAQESEYRDQGLDEDEIFGRVQRDVEKRFPELYENRERSRPAAVETKAPTRRATPKKPRLADLPEEFQEVGRKWVRQGLMKEDEYVQSLIDDGMIDV